MIKKGWISKSRKKDFLMGQKALSKSKIILLSLITFMLFLIIGIYKPSSVEGTHYIVNADIILPLKKNKVIQGVEFPEGSYVDYYKSGKLKSVRLGEPISVPGQLFPKVYFGDPTFITKIDFSAEAELFFYEGEKLKLKKIILPKEGVYSIRLPEITFCRGHYEKIKPKPKPFEIKEIRLNHDVVLKSFIDMEDGGSLSFYKSGRLKEVHLGENQRIPYESFLSSPSLTIGVYHRKSDFKRLKKMEFFPNTYMGINVFLSGLRGQFIEKGSYFKFNESGKLKEIYLSGEIKINDMGVMPKHERARIKHFNFNGRKLITLPTYYSSPLEDAICYDKKRYRKTGKFIIVYEDFIIDEDEVNSGYVGGTPCLNGVKIQGVYRADF